MSSETLLVIDGNSLVHRAFHAIPLLTTTEGLPTNAVYGFTNMLLKIIKDLQPKWLAVTFDKGKISFRTEQYSDYKAHRKATPQELRPQFPLVKEVLNAMSIKWYEFEGYEADDIIGTIVKQAEQKNINTVILTGDKDLLQLVSPSTKALLTKKGITELEEYNVDAVVKKFGVYPNQFIDLKGLMGDQSDNIPGVPGIGPKTAAKLLQEYKNIEEIIENLAIIPARSRNKIKEYKEQALLSKRLATINTDIPAKIEIDELILTEPNEKELLETFKKLEFNKLIKDMLYVSKNKTQRNSSQSRESALPQLDIYQVNYHTISDTKDYDDLLRAIREYGRVALAFEGNRERGLISYGLTFAKGQNYFIPVDKDKTEKSSALRLLQAVCEDQEIKKICYDTKANIWILNHHGIELYNLGFDIMLADYLLNPGKSSQSIEEAALKHLNVVLPSEGEAVLPTQADCIYTMYDVLNTKLVMQDEQKLYMNVELPLVLVLADMEKAGVKVDKKQLQLMSKELEKKLQVLTFAIYEQAGEEFNINSTKQLGRILFEKLKLKVIKKTKTGYSTDAAVLEELAEKHEIVSLLLEYRQLMKLKTTYVDGLTGLINPRTGKLHTTFHQGVTATGRLSSSDPNLQNIPIRLDAGRKIRKFFIPRRPENLILSADYSQIELRILAHIAQDPSLIEAFQKQQDIHTRTAAEVFGVPMEEVTSEMRGRAKAVNFGIVYGISDFGLSKDLKITRKEARQYIDNYFVRYAGVKAYIDRIIREARERGYVTTILNRRRYLPDLFSPNRVTRNFGERTAMNTPIQGSAADIIKLAMVRIHQEILKKKLSSTMILQVHDELIFDVPADEVEEMQELVRNCMENVIELSVPLIVDIKIGPNWYDVQKI
ncbi:DNA polymerase I [Desulfolucanica intricata]|uniref:DNA polymerase I n=1 Tax=Desulfolucanica intricata TaxID=1285191 RepID=UPI00082F5A44|nr:DNA polymerase I [Desulfolucanica intricata]